MDIDTIHLGVQSVALSGALGVLLYSVLARKVSKWRRPLYWLTLPVIALLDLIYIETFIAQVFGLRLLGFDQRGIMIRIAIFGISLLVYLVSFVDRLEYRTGMGVRDIKDLAEKQKDMLRADQQATMDEQHLVMGEQRTVMEEQRREMKDEEK